MRRLFVACVAAWVAGVAVSLATGGSGAGPGERWVIRDLGTLGGRESEAVAINERGQVVGWSTKTKSTNGLSPVRHVFLWQERRMRDLGPVGVLDKVVAVNDSGLVIGSVDDHAVVWRNGKMTRLTNRRSEALAVNVRGQVVGAVYRAGSEHPALWVGGRTIELGKRPGVAYDINDRGQVVGRTGCAEDSEYDQRCRAFLWQSGKMGDLGTLGGLVSEAVAINNRGQVVGDSTAKNLCALEDPHCGARAFLWDNGKMTNLGTLGGTSSWPIDLNERGLIIVLSGLGYSNGYEEASGPFVWRRGRTIPVRCQGTKVQQCSLSDLNDEGWAVGTDSGVQPVAWHNRTLTRLPQLASASFGEAVAINNHGQIVGYIDTSPGLQRHAVVWMRQPAVR